MSKVDLHIHSTASDGRFTPEEIVKKAADAGLSVIALADHDTVDGIAPALEVAKNFPSLKVIPGIELSTDVSRGEIHLLGYFIDYTSSELINSLKRMRDSRLNRAQAMVAKLTGLGLPVEWERVKVIAGDATIGRPHIAQAMLEKGYICSIKEAFNKYLGFGQPAYVKREKINPAEAVKLVLKSNGLPVMAHPLTYPEPEEMIIELKAAGLVGIEAYYGEFTPEEVNRMVKMAEKYGLISTGGSDYHGLDDNIEIKIGAVDVPLESAERLLALAEKRHLKLLSL